MPNDLRMRQSVGMRALSQKATYFYMSFNSQPQMLHPGCSGGKSAACSPVALVLVEVPCWGSLCVPGVRKRVCGCRASRSTLRPPSSSESNPTSLPIDVESDGNIFCSQNVDIVFTVLFCFLHFHGSDFTERRKVFFKKGGYRNKSHSWGKKSSVSGWLFCTPRLLMESTYCLIPTANGQVPGLRGGQRPITSERRWFSCTSQFLLALFSLSSHTTSIPLLPLCFVLNPHWRLCFYWFDEEREKEERDQYEKQPSIGCLL